MISWEIKSIRSVTRASFRSLKSEDQYVSRWVIKGEEEKEAEAVLVALAMDARSGIAAAAAVVAESDLMVGRMVIVCLEEVRVAKGVERAMRFAD